MNFEEVVFMVVIQADGFDFPEKWGNQWDGGYEIVTDWWPRVEGIYSCELGRIITYTRLWWKFAHAKGVNPLLSWLGIYIPCMGLIYPGGIVIIWSVINTWVTGKNVEKTDEKYRDWHSNLWYKSILSLYKLGNLQWQQTCSNTATTQSDNALLFFLFLSEQELYPAVLKDNGIKIMTPFDEIIPKRGKTSRMS